MESPGKYLKAERESRNLSLKEVSESTKIREHLLKAIEEDQYELISSPVYVKGFLNIYAKYLGLNPDDIILGYKNYLKNKTPSKRPELRQRMTPPRLKQWITFPKKSVNLRLFIISISVIVLLIAIMIYRISLKPAHHSVPYSGKEEPAVTPLPPVPSSPPMQKEVETRKPNPSGRSQPPQPMDTNLKHGILPESSQFEVIEAGLGTGVERKDDFLILTGKRSEFLCNNQKAYFLTRIKTKKGNKIVHVWFWKGEEFHKNEIDIKAPEWTVYSFITLKRGHTGDWKAEVRHDNKVLTSLSFKAIEPAFHFTPRRQ